MDEILKGKVKELQDEHNRITTAMEDMRQNFDKLNGRRIEIEGAIKELLSILNMKVEKNDTKAETPQGTDTN